MRAGPYTVGVRSNTHRVEAAVRDRLSEVVCARDDVPVHYSIRLEEPSPVAAPRRLHALYRGRCAYIRSRHADRVLTALEACLRGHAHPERLRVRQLALVSAAGAMLLPPALLPRVEAIEVMLAEAGIRLLEPPFVELDPRDGGVVVRGRTAAVPVSAVVLPPEVGPPTSPMTIPGALMPLVTETTADRDAALGALVRLARRARCVPTPVGDRHALCTRLRALVRAG